MANPIQQIKKVTIAMGMPMDLMSSSILVEFSISIARFKKYSGILVKYEL